MKRVLIYLVMTLKSQASTFLLGLGIVAVAVYGLMSADPSLAGVYPHFFSFNNVATSIAWLYLFFGVLVMVIALLKGPHRSPKERGKS